jgi:hypothetical protein
MCCKDKIDSFNVTKRLKAHPSDSTEVRSQMETCFNTTYEGVTKNCNDIYESLLNCQSQDHKKDWSKCIDIKKDLEKCAVKNRLGELA